MGPKFNLRKDISCSIKNDNADSSLFYGTDNFLGVFTFVPYFKLYSFNRLYFFFLFPFTHFLSFYVGFCLD